MTKRRKKVRPKKRAPEQDHFMLWIKHGERLYKFHYFRPMAGRHYHFEYRVLTKEKINGTLEMVSYNFKIENGIPQKSSITRVPEISKEQLDQIVQNVIRKTNAEYFSVWNRVGRPDPPVVQEGTNRVFVDHANLMLAVSGVYDGQATVEVFVSQAGGDQLVTQVANEISTQHPKTSPPIL